MKTFHSIRLVQRGVIRRPLGDFRGARISEAIGMDYMGSAEFEWGALPKSIKAFENNIDRVKMTLIPLDLPGAGDKMLRVLHMMDEEDLAQFTVNLQQLWYMDDGAHRRLKESLQFSYKEHRYNGKPYDTDFWWDIENHAMWSFDKSFMNHLVENLAASIKYMREQRVYEAKAKEKEAQRD